LLLGELRAAVANAGDRLAAAGLVPGTSGNLSARAGDLVAATPSGLPCGGLRAEQVTVIDLDGNVVDGDLLPTSEVPLHLALHRATDAGAVAHAHAATSTAVSCTCDELVTHHYGVVALGGPPRVAAYATFGSAELAANAVAALEGGRCAALLQNHGSLALGHDVEEACDRLELLEWLCEVHLRVVQLGGGRTLSNAELDAVRLQLGSDRYGQRGRPSA
jgi:L-fuculose-phosphate aldolase